MRRIQAHFPAFPAGAELWPRGIRACAGSKWTALKNPRSAGILRSLWSDSWWPQAKLHDKGLAPDPK
eukprot:3696390-Pyramimonas_sp.AAC.1